MAQLPLTLDCVGAGYERPLPYLLSIDSQITSQIYSEPKHLARGRAARLAGCLPGVDRSWAQVLV